MTDFLPTGLKKSRQTWKGSPDQVKSGRREYIFSFRGAKGRMSGIIFTKMVSAEHRFLHSLYYLVQLIPRRIMV
jgi:hypothetical protein